jgi:hypothetical protein
MLSGVLQPCTLVFCAQSLVVCTPGGDNKVVALKLGIDIVAIRIFYDGIAVVGGVEM